jgi:hypothetical protein
MVGLGVAGVSVGDAVGEGVGSRDGSRDGEAVGDAMLAVGEAEADGPGLAAGAPQAATSTKIRMAATD